MGDASKRKRDDDVAEVLYLSAPSHVFLDDTISLATLTEVA
jgi:hypothetical protein